jgi:hypothetical protein
MTENKLYDFSKDYEDFKKCNPDYHFWKSFCDTLSASRRKDEKDTISKDLYATNIGKRWISCGKPKLSVHGTTENDYNIFFAYLRHLLNGELDNAPVSHYDEIQLFYSLVAKLEYLEQENKHSNYDE